MAASDRTARPKAAFVYMVRCTGGQLYRVQRVQKVQIFATHTDVFLRSR